LSFSRALVELVPKFGAGSLKLGHPVVNYRGHSVTASRFVLEALQCTSSRSFTLAAADDLADPQCQHAHRRDCPAVVVLPVGTVTGVEYPVPYANRTADLPAGGPAV
jgi:hypothetical protein